MKKKSKLVWTVLLIFFGILFLFIMLFKIFIDPSYKTFFFLQLPNWVWFILAIWMFLGAGLEYSGYKKETTETKRMDGEYVTNVWYETPERVDKSFTRLKVYSDVGNLVLRLNEIDYFGKKTNFTIKNIQNISLYKPKKIATKGVPYIKIDYKDVQDNIKSAFFINGAFSIFTAKKRTNQLYQILLNKYKDT
jgi:hypothetical protein